MAVDRSRYRRLMDLYVTGTEVELLDGSVLWMQVLNPFERDEATHDAQVARARVALALREPDSEEMAKVRSIFAELGPDACIQQLLETKRVTVSAQCADEMRVEEEWRETSDLLMRATSLATTATPEELEVLARAANRYMEELTKRVTAQLDHEQHEYEQLGTDALRDEYEEWWLERRGGEVALAEYKLTEMWLASRACAGVKGPDGAYDHGACDGHRVRVFDSKDEVRGLPQSLQEVLLEGLAKLEMSERDARFSRRQGSSSASSPLPSVEEESTRSTPTEVSATAPGPWPSP